MAKSAEQEWFTVAQASRYLGVCKQTIRNWRKSGRLPNRGIGVSRWTREELDAAASNQATSESSGSSVPPAEEPRRRRLSLELNLPKRSNNRPGGAREARSEAGEGSARPPAPPAPAHEFADDGDEEGQEFFSW